MTVLDAATMVREVAITGDDLRSPRFTPRELALIREQFGRSFSAIVADDESDDRFTVLAWLKLHRDHPDLTRDDIQDVVIRFEIDAPDPTNARPATISPRSAGTGE